MVKILRIKGTTNPCRQLSSVILNCTEKFNKVFFIYREADSVDTVEVGEVEEHRLPNNKLLHCKLYRIKKNQNN